ncbi:hypothetical protein [Citrobacter sp. Cpo150]|uniref:hypothetical protein n=1 Tax=Citrobacter sp. Cpo150 TaxID=2985154 RepID=UPI00257530E2|nr:hypothetical protein [Citrobacter sp. Cpo150]MDM2765723.1 hypothetical protein [Citrobacter sp. Cpo150]
MKNWLFDFCADIRFIWGEFVREVNETKVQDSFEPRPYNAEFSPEWNATPDFDPRKSVNNIDNPISHDTIHGNIYGHHNGNEHY